jgi:STE24 endopeptidase
MIRALKKLTADNMGNPTPHPLHVFLSASHPPVAARIQALAGKTEVRHDRAEH